MNKARNKANVTRGESVLRAACRLVASTLQKKLEWYAENQELVTKNDALVAEQRGIIQQLQARLAAYEGREEGRGVRVKREDTVGMAEERWLAVVHAWLAVCEGGLGAGGGGGG